MIEGDKYCRYCGAPLGVPDFVDELFACLYGPPSEMRNHKCERCGYSWRSQRMVDNERWCPQCGDPAPAFGDE